MKDVCNFFRNIKSRLELYVFGNYVMIMNFDLDHEHILNVAKEKILMAFPDVLAIYIFGSFGTKYEKKDSDLDVAILPTKGVDTIVLWNLAQEIAIKINKDVDLIDLTSASTVFRHQIISSGTRIYCHDETQCAFIENCFTSMYLRFKEDRALWMK